MRKFLKSSCLSLKLKSLMAGAQTMPILTWLAALNTRQTKESNHWCFSSSISK